MLWPKSAVKKTFSANRRGIYRKGSQPPWNELFQFIDNDPCDPIIADSSRQIFSFTTGGQNYHLKRYTCSQSPRRSEQIGCRLPGSRSPREQELLNGLYLLERQFSVVKPEAALSWTAGRLARHSLFLSQTHTGQPLSELLGLQSQLEPVLELPRKGLKVLHRMHQQQIYFGATEPRNVLVDQAGELVRLDFERVKINRRLTSGKLTDLRRFLRRLYKDCSPALQSDKRFIPELGRLAKQLFQPGLSV